MLNYKFKCKVSLFFFSYTYMIIVVLRMYLYELDQKYLSKVFNASYHFYYC